MIETLFASLPQVSVGTLGLMLLIYAASALFSGLSGFGFSAVGSLTLLLLAPRLAIPLLMALSLITQTTSSASLWKEFRKHSGPITWTGGVTPFIFGGVFGLPFGLLILSHFPPKLLMEILGGVLVCYATWSLLKPATLIVGGGQQRVRSSFMVGAAGGLIGGFSGFPGCALVVWNGLTGASKEAGRALTQPFILVMQILALGILVSTRTDWFDDNFWTLFVIALPTALVFNQLGVAIYRRTGDIGYRYITLIALGCSGLGLWAKSMLA